MGKSGEIGCLAVDPRYRSDGQANALLSYVKREAMSMGLERLFALSTVTSDWFLERGFSRGTIADLPPERQEKHKILGRNSKVFIQHLVSQRAIDAEELLLGM